MFLTHVLISSFDQMQIVDKKQGKFLFNLNFLAFSSLNPLLLDQWFPNMFGGTLQQETFWWSNWKSTYCR